MAKTTAPAAATTPSTFCCLEKVISEKRNTMIIPVERIAMEAVVPVPGDVAVCVGME